MFIVYFYHSMLIVYFYSPGPRAGGGLPPGAGGAGGAPAAGAQEHRRGHRLRQLHLLQAQLTAAQDAPQQGDKI